ncbi:mechanosensitive ion channel family protein [Flavitalea flava]
MLKYTATFLRFFAPAILFLLLSAGHTQAQDSATQKSAQDSIKSAFVQKMQQFATSTRKESVTERDRDKTDMHQDELFEVIKKTMQGAKTFMKNGIDTAGIGQDLADITNWHRIAGDGIFQHAGRSQTYRNLTTTSNLLQVMQNRVTLYKTELDSYQHKLSVFRYQLDSLASDSTMFAFSSDSAEVVKYLQKLGVMAHEIAPVVSMLKKAMSHVQTLQTEVNMQVYKIVASRDEIELYQRDLYRHTFNRELPDIWGKAGQDRPFSEVVKYSLAKGLLTLRFYGIDNLGKIGLLLLLTILSALYLLSLKKIYQQQNLLQTDRAGQLVLRYPLLSAIMIVFNVFQFLFFSPPFIFSAILWIISAGALTYIFHGFISRYWMRVWLAIAALFLLACLDNLILQASWGERWMMLLLALAGMIISMVALARGSREVLKEKWIIYFIGFLAVLELASVLANCSGRYNFSKTLLSSGYFNVIIAIMFLWTARLINEGIALAFRVYTGQEKKLFYINFQRVGPQAPPLFYIFLIAGWLILFGRNFYAFRLISNPIKDFLSDERSVGDYTFTINTLLLFVFIMGLSVVISRIVSYFATDRHAARPGNPAKEVKAAIGSWLLLVRISIITLGLFFAFAAAGIPMDKIAIIMGALGVGIGFGLQTLVNNLVSGLILAFEKPVNVGDVVDVDNQGGTMKSIGFRSSIISTWDGADMIMPNGDLLKSHLINWTLAGNKKRMNIVVGVAYGTDLEFTQQLLRDIMGKDERILKYPAPVVLFQEFRNSTIEVKLFFWARSLNDSSQTKSDLIIAIDKAFKENNFTNPFLQQEIYIHKPPPQSPSSPPSPSSPQPDQPGN